MGLLSDILTRLVLWLLLAVALVVVAHWIVKKLFGPQAAKDFKKWIQKQAWKLSTRVVRSLWNSADFLARHTSRLFALATARWPVATGIVLIVMLIVTLSILFS